MLHKILKELRNADEKEVVCFCITQILSQLSHCCVLLVLHQKARTEFLGREETEPEDIKEHA